MTHCVNILHGDEDHVSVAECKDDASFRNSEGHRCDMYRSPVSNSLYCGAVGHEGTCQACCFSCNGEEIAPLCADGGAQQSTRSSPVRLLRDKSRILTIHGRSAGTYWLRSLATGFIGSVRGGSLSSRGSVIA